MTSSNKSHVTSNLSNNCISFLYTTFYCYKYHWPRPRLVISMECRKKIIWQCDQTIILSFLCQPSIFLKFLKAREIAWVWKSSCLISNMDLTMATMVSMTSSFNVMSRLQHDIDHQYTSPNDEFQYFHIWCTYIKSI